MTKQLATIPALNITARDGDIITIKKRNARDLPIIAATMEAAKKANLTWEIKRLGPIDMRGDIQIKFFRKEG
jgi:hypothetical protein